MEPETLSAPPVVAVVVADDPGEWFDDTLDALARQDYPNLRILFLVVAEREAVDGAETIDERIQQRLPGAFVRAIGINVGFGSAANEVLRLVEGDKGFFLFCHDDVAPEPDALRLMVVELYRSNAGAVGPKLVEWDDPSVLQAVGLGMDRFGEIDPVIEAGEVDQEQHDAVRDVFVIPGAATLVRADLFATIGGYDEAIDHHNDDLALCWRAHLAGARVIVTPDAVARHVEALGDRCCDQRLGDEEHVGGARAGDSGERVQQLLVDLVDRADRLEDPPGPRHVVAACSCARRGRARAGVRRISRRW